MGGANGSQGNLELIVFGQYPPPLPYSIESTADVSKQSEEVSLNSLGGGESAGFGKVS